MTVLRLASGETVRIASPNAVDIGAEVEIAIRQESILTGPASPNPMQGILQDATFYGDHVRLVVHLREGLTVIAKSNPQQFAVPAVGAAITIGIPERDFALIFNKKNKGN
jgi:ABC-type Fe3+/spermidine/putrescine transport system ATPase subunit